MTKSSAKRSSRTSAVEGDGGLWPSVSTVDPGQARDSSR